jgi:hypothetical protein
LKGRLGSPNVCGLRQQQIARLQRLLQVKGGKSQIKQILSGLLPESRLSTVYETPARAMNRPNGAAVCLSGFATSGNVLPVAM